MFDKEVMLTTKGGRETSTADTSSGQPSAPSPGEEAGRTLRSPYPPGAHIKCALPAQALRAPLEAVAGVHAGPLERGSYLS